MELRKTKLKIYDGSKSRKSSIVIFKSYVEAEVVEFFFVKNT